MVGEMRVVIAKLVRSLIRLAIIGTLLPSNDLVFFPVSGLLCYECTSHERQVFCNSTASIRSCPDQEICLRQLIQRQDWLDTPRGCSNTTKCQELERGNDPGCLQGRVTTTCSWCCSTDYCNHDGFPQMQKDFKDNNTDDLGISESTTTDPSDPVATKEDNCSTSQNVNRCLTQFQEGIESVVRGNRTGFASFCRNIPELFRCLTASSSCSYNATAATSALSAEGAVDRVWEKLLDSCPGACNRTAGLVCVLEGFQVVMSFLENRSSSVCEDLLRKVRGGFQCIALSVGSCEDGGETMAAADRVLRDLESAAQSLCPRLPPGDDLENNLQLMTKVQLPPCQLAEAMHCISKAGVAVIRNRIEPSYGSSVLCHGRGFIEENVSCSRSRSDSCVLGRRKRALLAEAVVDRLLVGRSCDTSQPPFGCNTTAARLRIVELLRMTEGSDVQEACNSLEETKSFVKLKTEKCKEEEKQSLNRTLSLVLVHVAKYCTPNFQCLSKETIILTEGGKPEVVAVRITASPKSICSLPGCKVILDILPDMKRPPNCRNRSPISQFLVLDGDGHCSRHVTGDGGDGVYAFHLAAKIDFKYDNAQQRALRIVMRKMVNGTQIERRTICEHKVVVIDRDRQSVCQSVTDPHVITFDGRAYNNFLEGFFTLYRHRLFPYEVQVAFQRCVGGGATCTCAVAVRAGDSVFFVDRCRKRAPVDGTWPKDACGGRGRSRVTCSDFATAKMFYHEKITPGFRVHTRGDTGFELLLPHGSRVLIRGEPWYNVYVYPSPYDWNQTEGLCGTYDNQPKNDLTLRNGRLFRESLSHRSEPPLDFSLDWRVSEDQLLANGVALSPFRLPVYCDCEQGSNADGSPLHLCGSSRILELCDFNSEGDITFKLPRGNQRSYDNDLANSTSKKSRRDIGGGSKTFDAYDFDLNPDVDVGQFGNWTKAVALEYCEKKLLNESVAIRNCVKYLHDFDAEFALESCVEDLLLSGDTSFVGGALSVLKVQCVEQLASNVSLYNSEEGGYVLLEVEETLCMEDCGLHGICFQGRCYCESGFTGSSCGTSTRAAPGSVALMNGGLCDLSQVDCTWAVVVGDTFINTTNLVCLLQEVQFMADGSVTVGKNVTAPAVFISAHQALCSTGDNVEASYFISISNNGVTFSDRQVFLSRDLTCHECRLNVTDGQVCRLKANACLVLGKCYSSGEEHRSDPCLVCDPSRSTVELRQRGGHGCSSQGQNVLTAMLVTLAVVMCLLAVALVFRLKRKSIRSARLQPKAVEKPKEPQTVQSIPSNEGHTNVALETIPE